MKAFRQNIKKRISKTTWTSCNLKKMSTCLTSSLKTFCKKKDKGGRAKGDAKNHDAIRGATKFDRGMNVGSKLKRT
jgi:hypothetical protein